MRKTCAACGEEFEAKRTAAKYCNARCRQRAHRRPVAAKAPKVVTLPPAAPASTGSLAAATRAELDRAGRLASAVGQAALALARRIDAGHGETGSALAALVREHRATLAEAVKDAEVAADPVDQLKARRERKLAGN